MTIEAIFERIGNSLLDSDAVTTAGFHSTYGYPLSFSSYNVMLADSGGATDITVVIK